MEQLVINTVIDLPDEVWMPIEGFTNQEISNYGRARNARRVKNGIILARLTTYQLTSDGRYLTIQIYSNDSGQRIHSVHRLVAQAFIPNPDNLPEVNHKDGDRYNCRVDNLEWCTGLENSQHRDRNHLQSRPTGISRGVIQIDLNGVEIKKYPSIASAARENRYKGDSIRNVMDGRSITYKGFKWIDDINFDAKKYQRDIAQSSQITGINQSIPIIQLDLNNNKINEFPSIGSAAKQLQLQKKSIRAVLQGKQQTTGGYKWKIKE